MPDINNFNLMKWGSEINGDQYDKFSVYWRKDRHSDWVKVPIYEPHGFEYLGRSAGINLYIVFGHEEILHFLKGKDNRINRIYTR